MSPFEGTEVPPLPVEVRQPITWMYEVRVVKLAEGVEWGVHAVTLLATLPPDAALPAAKLAEFHGVPPAYLAKSLQALARAGIVESVPGRRGGYPVGRAAEDVTPLGIVEGIEGGESSVPGTESPQRRPARLA